MRKRFESQPGALAKDVNKGMKYKGGQRDGICFLDQPVLLWGYSTPGFLSSKNKDALIQIDQYKSPRFDGTYHGNQRRLPGFKFNGNYVERLSSL